MYCLTPFSKRDEVTGKWSTFPCGKCPACLARHRSEWIFRITQEWKRWKSCAFVTLTYDDDNLRLPDKRTFQLFMKRLRQKMDNKLVYYACSEYGDKSFRPHFHAVFFGSWIDHDRFKRLIFESWPFGLIDYVPHLSPKIVSYVTKYMLKSDRDRLAALGLPDNFRLMSKGLGRSWLENPENHVQTLNNLENGRWSVSVNGDPIALPRYYRDKIVGVTDSLKSFVKKFSDEFNDYVESVQFAEDVENGLDPYKMQVERKSKIIQDHIVKVKRI